MNEAAMRRLRSQR